MNYDKLHVLAVVSNPCQYKTRYLNYEIFAEDITAKGATLWTIELQVGARDHKITKCGNRYHIQIWTSSLPGEIWHKENLMNLWFPFLSVANPDWRYAMTVDADTKWQPGALERVVERLQHYDIVQCWSHLVNLGPDGHCDGTNIATSYMYNYDRGVQVINKSEYQRGGAPGLAWAGRREAFNKIGTMLGGPFIDHGILGAGDRYFAASLVGEADTAMDPLFSANYRKWIKIYEATAVRELKRNIGYVPNTVMHLYHGKYVDRQYESRGEILIRHRFDPETDIKRDVSGVLMFNLWEPRVHRLRDDCRKYFQKRKEDTLV